jgi:hypothetical protein
MNVSVIKIMHILDIFRHLLDKKWLFRSLNYTSYTSWVHWRKLISIPRWRKMSKTVPQLTLMAVSWRLWQMTSLFWSFLHNIIKRCESKWIANWKQVNCIVLILRNYTISLNSVCLNLKMCWNFKKELANQPTVDSCKWCAVWPWVCI